MPVCKPLKPVFMILSLEEPYVRYFVDSTMTTLRSRHFLNFLFSFYFFPAYSIMLACLLFSSINGDLYP
jgi:hypothetical protein